VRSSPAVVLWFWNGMSSFGGLAGAFLGLSVDYARAGRSWLPMADVVGIAVAVRIRRRSPGARGAVRTAS
jgi:prolipoprotein diacylglyceryltransferase